MLPAPSTPGSRPVPLLGRLTGLLLALVLLLPLTACGAIGQPPRSVVLEALGLQIQLTQGAIAQALRLERTGVPEVSRVRVDSQESIRIGEANGWHLAGRFDWRLQGDPIRVDSPFELYLQRGVRGQSWRLARPSVSEAAGPQAWITDPLPLASGRSS